MRSTRDSLMERYSRRESSVPLIAILSLVGAGMVILLCVSLGGGHAASPRPASSREIEQVTLPSPPVPRDYSCETSEEREERRKRESYEWNRNWSAIREARRMRGTRWVRDD